MLLYLGYSKTQEERSEAELRLGDAERSLVSTEEECQILRQQVYCYCLLVILFYMLNFEGRRPESAFNCDAGCF